MRPSVVIAALVGLAVDARADSPATSPKDPSLDDNLDAGEADFARPEPEQSPWNQYDGRLITARFGGGFLLDAVGYNQSPDSREQMMLDPTWKVRDFRILIKGKFKFAPRLSYTIGYMYDGADNDWHFRQTGLMFDVKELEGRLFIGRTKEGFSTNKLMVGYNGWTNERAAANDAFLPILADGFKWTQGVASGHLVYNVGFFMDALSETESFNRNDRQAVGRVVYLPFARSESDTLLHLCGEIRYGVADDGKLQFRSKPESFAAQSFAVDTGELDAISNTILGAEMYYRKGRFLVGGEYFWNKVQSPSTMNPFFQGGEILTAYVVTGEIRTYNEKGAFFEALVPRKSLPDGGTGAVELVLRLSYVDLDSELIAGGRFARLTPMVSWYVSDNLRLELTYGYGLLDRMNVVGQVQFFQTRMQWTLM